MSYLSYLLTLCSIYQFLSPYQSFVVLSNVFHFLTPYYQFNFYVIISPHKCTCCTHHTTQLSFLFYRAHALCANTFFQLTRRLWLSCHSAMGGIETWLGGFSLRTSVTLQIFLGEVFAALFEANLRWCKWYE